MTAKTQPPIDPTLAADLETLARLQRSLDDHKAGMAAKIPDGVPVLRKRGDTQAVIAYRGQLVFRPVYYLEDLPQS